MKVLISTSTFGKADPRPMELISDKCGVVLNPYGRKLTTEEFIELAENVDGVIAGVERITEEALRKRPDIKVISRCGVGMDSVDLDACRRHSVKVYNTPEAPVESVAELTVSILLGLMKNIPCMDRDIKAGKWNKMTGYLLKGKKIGIIGFGRIGRRVAALLEGFGVELAYYDLCRKEGRTPYMEKEALLRWADVITLHSSECEEGSYIIGGEQLAIMKRTAFLVNTSRGSFVDEEALYQALKENRLAGAALDVFSREPYYGKLCGLDQVILTPHISSSAKESRAVMELEAARNLLEGLGIAYD